MCFLRVLTDILIYHLYEVYASKDENTFVSAVNEWQSQENRQIASSRFRKDLHLESRVCMCVLCSIYIP